MGSLWNRSGTIERYADDLRAAGAQAFFYLGGTTTPFTVFSDSGESSAYPSPVLADADGRWPNIFIPYTVSYDVQVKSADGVQLTFTQRVPNPNPVDISTTVPPEATVQTGMIHGEMVNSVKAGYVRLNGRTIGSSATSGVATERANDDTQKLFTYLWNLDPSIVTISGGRGSSAASDFSPGNKVATLPDWRGIGPMGLDDMGNTAGGFFTGLTFTVGNATMPGATVGANGISLDISNMPNHSHSGTTGTQSANHTHLLSVSGTASGTTSFVSNDHTHTFGGTTSGVSADHTHAYENVSAVGANPVFGVGGGHATSSTGGQSNDHTHTYSGTTSGITANHTHTFSTTVSSSGTSGTESATHTHTFTTDAKGSGTSFNNLSRKRLVTWFIKL
jgi:hypothetical protein